MLGKCGGFHVCAFGLALGIVWGLGVLLLGLAAWQFAWGVAFLDLLASVYVGYAATLTGSLIGFGWGFLDAFIGGVVFAFLYNLFATYCCGKTKE